MKVHFLLDQFPLPSENFIYREMQGLREAGIEIQLLAFRPGPALGPQARSTQGLGKCFYYPGFMKPATWGAILRMAIRKPGILGRENWKIWCQNLFHPRRLAHRYNLLARACFFLKYFPKKSGHLHAMFASAPCEVARYMAMLGGTNYSFSGHARDLYVEGGDLRGKLAAAQFALVCTKVGAAYLQAQADEKDAAKVHQVYHGLPLQKWPLRPGLQHAEKKQLSLLTVARLEKKKGLTSLIAACELLHERGLAFKVDIVGEGPERASLEACIQTRGLDARVKLWGALPLEEVRKMYQTADIMVFPGIIAADGDRDGLPNVILEAAAIGVPVVASQVGAVGEFITQGENGSLVEPGDEVALADAIWDLQADRAIWGKWIKTARNKVEAEFSMGLNTRKLKDIFETYCHEKMK